MSRSSPIITSSISLQWPSFTISGWSKVELISPPDHREHEVIMRHTCVCVCARVSVRERTSDQGKALDASEVCVFDGHDAGLSEQLLRVVVDQLPVEREEELQEEACPLFVSLFPFLSLFNSLKRKLVSKLHRSTSTL